jgi:hypothetical protein
MEKAVAPVARTLKAWAEIEELGYNVKSKKLREHVRMFGMIDAICHLRLILSVCTMKEKLEWINNTTEDGAIITKAWELWYGVVPTILYYHDQKSGNLIDIRLKEITRQEYDALKTKTA